MDFDIGVVGAGFGGAIFSLIAQRLGYSTLLVERGAHPRFAIGESTSPLFNLLLEETAERYGLPVLQALSAYGSWQRTYPHIACGLKRGFTFFEHCASKICRAATHSDAQLMVAASPCDEVADTHWYRADVDAFLVEEAQRLGVTYTDHTKVQRVCRVATGGWQLEGERQGRAWHATCGLLVDASGPRGFLARYLNLANASFPGYPATQAIYSHFVGVKRCEGSPGYPCADGTPYPMDDAAVHHLFDGGWIWILRFNNGITSAGATLDRWLAEELGAAADPPGAWGRLLHRFPSLQTIFEGSQPVLPFVFSPSLPWRCSEVAGEEWVLLPSAVASIDPLFSTGFPLNLLGILRLAEGLEEGLTLFAEPQHLQEYAEATLQEADFTAQYVAGCRKAMRCFPVFVALSMFYFAASSYAEMARRFKKPHLVSRYLAADRADFRAGWSCCMEQLNRVLSAPTPKNIAHFERSVADAVEPLNVAGLCVPSKANRYGVDWEDVVRGASKLGFTPQEIRTILATAPWALGCTAQREFVSGKGLT